MPCCLLEQAGLEFLWAALIAHGGCQLLSRRVRGDGHVSERVERSFWHIFLFKNQTDPVLHKKTEQFEPAFTDRDPRMVFKLEILQFFQVGADFI